MRRALRWGLGLLAGVVLLAGGGVVALIIALDAGTLTPRLVAAIEGATGRRATLGAVSLRPGLTPTLAVDGATLANLPGGSRPEMARIRRLEASLALLPLLRGEVVFRRIALDGADVLLERLVDGSENWALRPPARPEAPARAETRPPGPQRRVTLGEVLLTDSRVTLPDPRLGTVDVERARITGLGEGGPVVVGARLALHGVAATLEAETGPLPASPGAVLPLRAALAIGGNRLTAEGRIGGALAVSLALAQPAGLLPLVAVLAPGTTLPQVLPPAEASFKLDGSLRPSDITLRLGAADLSALLPDLALTRLELRAPDLDSAARVTAEGRRNGLDLRLSVGIDPPAALLPFGPERPVAIQAAAEAGGATARIAGRIARPRALAGATLDLEVAAADLDALSPLLPGLPALRDLRAEARLAMPGRLTDQIRIASFRIAASALEAEGALILRPGRPFGVEGRITAERLDLDALRRGAAAPAPAPAPASDTAAPAPPPAASGARVIPDLPLPIGAIRDYRGQIAFAAAQVTAGGAAWRQVRGTLALADGQARLAPFAAVTPGGPVQGEARLDATADPPAVALSFRTLGRGLDLTALRRATGSGAGPVNGHAEITLDLRGQGTTTRALAASLDGEAGFAMVDGRLTRAALNGLTRDLVGLLMPGGIPADGVALRCVALRMTAQDGVARSRALLADTSAGQVGGVAAVNLREETIAARLLPDVQMFGVRVRAPVAVGGTLAAPRLGVQAGQAAGQVLGDALAGRLAGDAPLDWLRGQGGAAAPQADCASALRLARLGAAGSEPAPRAEPQAEPQQPQPQPAVPGVPRDLQGPAQDLLRGLFGGSRR